VLAELDSFSGLALPTTFRRAVPKAYRGKIHIHTYTYAAGIDGALPKNALGIEEKADKDSSSGTKASTPVQEAPEGQSQIDYFRRLADTLEWENKRIIAGDKSRKGIQAVVVLGGDIYDKLQILRTLRPRLSGALFLTNGLDARYGHPDEWEETRNLIVAASYPLQVDWKKKMFKRDEPLFPPFRDSVQTATYWAARHAINTDGKLQRGHVGLYEIGKSGPVLLREAKPGDPAHPGLHWQKRDLPWHSHWGADLIAVAMLVLMAWLLLRYTREAPIESRSKLGRVAGWASRSDLAVPMIILLSAAITCWRYCSQDPNTAEPFALYDGISIWPGDFVRLCVLLLAVHFIFKILVDLGANSQKLHLARVLDRGLHPERLAGSLLCDPPADRSARRPLHHPATSARKTFSDARH